MSQPDRELRFHREWLGLAQPIEGLVFSIPVLCDAQITPEIRAELSLSFDSALDAQHRIADLATFFRRFLGYSTAGMIVPRAELPASLAFYAPEGGQEIKPSFALGGGPYLIADFARTQNLGFEPAMKSQFEQLSCEVGHAQALTEILALNNLD